MSPRPVGSSSPVGSTTVSSPPGTSVDSAISSSPAMVTSGSWSAIVATVLGCATTIDSGVQRSRADVMSEGECDSRRKSTVKRKAMAGE
ncbi:hypothetical protein KC338_g33 [Hortaea werneckii]|nr:hypothetical protein KC338_g33 [Hortaea werneckii]